MILIVGIFRHGIYEEKCSINNGDGKSKSNTKLFGVIWCVFIMFLLYFAMHFQLIINEQRKSNSFTGIHQLILTKT
jgi:hypothetical protein